MKGPSLRPPYTAGLFLKTTSARPSRPATLRSKPPCNQWEGSSLSSGSNPAFYLLTISPQNAYRGAKSFPGLEGSTVWKGWMRRPENRPGLAGPILVEKLYDATEYGCRNRDMETPKLTH